MIDTTGRLPHPAARTRRRWRTVMILLGISIGWKLVVLTLGAAVPRWLVKDGIDQLPLDLQPYGSHAKAIAIAAWNKPIERHGVIRGVRVRAVDRSAGGESAQSCGGVNARRSRYTDFASPYS